MSCRRRHLRAVLVSWAKCNRLTDRLPNLSLTTCPSTVTKASDANSAEALTRQHELDRTDKSRTIDDLSAVKYLDHEVGVHDLSVMEVGVHDLYVMEVEIHDLPSHEVGIHYLSARCDVIPPHSNRQRSRKDAAVHCHACGSWSLLVGSIKA